MALQVRLTNALGQRLVDLVERGVDRPIVVGRGAGVDIQVPSTLVSPQHCVLFVHEGRWIVQDMVSAAGTFVNGERLEDSAYLNCGDILALGQGASAPTIEIDPLGIMRAAPVGAGGTSSGSPHLAPGEEEARDQPAVVAQTARVHPPQPGGEQQSVSEETAEIESSPPSLRYYVPHHRTPTSVLVVGAICAAVIMAIGGLVLWLAQRQPPSSAPVARQPTKAKGASIFDDMRASSRSTGRRPVGPPSEVTPRTTGGDTPTPDASGPDPSATVEPEPRTVTLPDEIDQTLLVANPARLIQQCRAYLQRQRQSPDAKAISQLIEQAADRLWWMRIAELCEARDRHRQRIAQIDVEIEEASDADFKRGRQAERMGIEERRQRCAELLAEMGYTLSEPPPMDDPTRMARLRMARGKDFFDRWKATAILRAAQTGANPWAMAP